MEFLPTLSAKGARIPVFCRGEIRTASHSPSGTRILHALLSPLLICLATLALSGCTVIRGLADPPTAFVGEPRIYDGRRLQAEFASRILEVEKAIDKAEIGDVDTTARVVSNRSIQLNLLANTFNDPISQANAEALIASEENKTATQNLYLQRLQSEINRNELLQSNDVQQSEEQQTLREARIAQHQVLLDHYTAILTSDDVELEQKIQAATALQALDTTSLTTTPGGTESQAGALPEGGGSNPLQPNVEDKANNSAEDPVGSLTELVTTLNEFNKKSNETTQLVSPRREQFQQFQSYLDELYAQRNRYLLDDTVRQTGNRYIRLVFPVYVPPSGSTKPTKIEFKLTKMEPEVNDSQNNDHLTDRTVLIDVLNYLSDEIDDNAADLGYTQAKIDIVSMHRALSSFHGSRECPNKDDWFDQSEGKLESLDVSKDQSRINKTWDILNAARQIGFRQASNYCLQVDKGIWEAPTNPADLNTFSNPVKEEAADLKTDSSPMRVYALDPAIEREKFDQTLSRVNAVNVALTDRFGSVSSLGEASLGASVANQLIAQAATRAPTIAAFQSTNNQTNNQALQFGWQVYPRLTINTNQTLVNEHIGTEFLASADISIPFNVKRFRVEIEVNGVGAGDKNIKLPDISYFERFGNVTDVPIVTSVKEYGIQRAKKPFKILLRGYNLWRNPNVTIGGKRATNIEFTSGSEHHLIASFDNLQNVTCDYGNKFFNTKYRYHQNDIDPQKHCALKIWLHTSKGREYAGSLVLLKSELDQNDKPAASAKPTTEIFAVREIAGNALELVWLDSDKPDYAKALKEGDPVDIRDIRDNSTGAKIFAQYKGKTAVPGREGLFYYKTIGDLHGEFCIKQRDFQNDCKIDVVWKEKQIVSDFVNIDALPQN